MIYARRRVTASIKNIILHSIAYIDSTVINYSLSLFPYK